MTTKKNNGEINSIETIFGLLYKKVFVMIFIYLAGNFYHFYVEKIFWPINSMNYKIFKHKGRNNYAIHKILA